MTGKVIDMPTPPAAPAPPSTAPSAKAIRRLRQLGKAHPLWAHPFLARCMEGQLALHDVRALASQMYRFTREFSPLLARILAACPDEEVRVVIGENLFEELGEGNRHKTHVELFRHFTRALGLDDATLEGIPAEPETRRLVEVYLSLSDRYGYLPALAAVCFASEGIVSTLYAKLQNGIENAISLTPDDLIFFDLHIKTDTGHAAALVEVLEPRLEDGAELVGAVAAVLEAMDARRGFFDGVDRLAERLAREMPRQTEVMSR
jgi:pyrroloquinoline-quinone synthase